MSAAHENRPDALRTWLALEHEAVWFYPLAGARVPSLERRARASWTDHARERDRLLAVVDDPPPTHASYATGDSVVASVKDAERVAQGLERRIQAACLAVLAVSDPADRRLPLDGLRRAALAELTWGGSPRPFPGLD